MEPIKQAVDRARTEGTRHPEPTAVTAAPPTAPIARQQLKNGSAGSSAGLRDFELGWDYLESQRVVAHNVADPRSKAYEILRTQVLQSMDKRGWRLLAVTSPTPGCGKTLTAVNLALSIARQPERSVVLVDLDLQRPKVANYLGLKCDHGVISVLAGRTSMRDAIVNAHIGGYYCPVLAAEARSIHSSELIASRALRTLLQDIKEEFPSATVVLDLPPVMSGDDVLTMLPYVDCFLLVAAVGSSSVSDVRECNRFLHSAEVVRIVLNKASEHRAYVS
jgi:protein-tyrosine kinase